MPVHYSHTGIRPPSAPSIGLHHHDNDDEDEHDDNDEEDNDNIKCDW